ncbi:MAG: hypothetical protein JWM16_594 [Verrucomicrobiales bacterium]|nr:hypothetical protein [Verrucomicrobiales bacterium]
MHDKMQLQRFELKYMIDDATALGVRDFVSTRLELDEFSVGKPNFSYPVHSLYLDSDDLHLFQSTVNSEKNRYKLRLRYYSDKPGSPVFFEIKRRVDGAILKQRCGVRREAVEEILGGHVPEPDQFLSKEPKNLVALQRFVELMEWIGAKPKVHVAYLREAWLPHDGNSVRITMDRNVRDDPDPTARLACQMLNPVDVFGNQVVLEIKFTGRFPAWIGDMVRIFRLQRCSAAKYVDGICRMTDKWGGGHSSEIACRILGSVSRQAIQARARHLSLMPDLADSGNHTLLPST